MASLATIPLARRPELLVSPLGDDGQHVIKDPVTTTYFRIGPEEAFLLAQLDGKKSAEDICRGFEERFGEALSLDDLQGFLELAFSQGFLEPVAAPQPAAQPGAALPTTGDDPAAAQARPRPRSSRIQWQNILYIRKNFFDPDRFFNWLEPKLGFVWKSGFLVLSAVGILLAAAMVLVHWREIMAFLPSAVRWETVFVGGATLLAVTFLHEFAHGLTCKHYGGEVHEVGFLLLFFMPCFYCNISDAWLFREKAKRLAVTLAGGYCDLFIWSLAVFAWRLAQPGTTLSFVAWVVLSVLGARVFFNFNPLLKLDGYYLLSDWAEIPNLRPRSWSRLMAHLRRLLWGAPRPEADPRALFVMIYGFVSWLFSLTYLGLMLAGMIRFLGPRWGLLGLMPIAALAVLSLKSMFGEFSAGEITTMIQLRHKRTALWILVLGAVPAFLYFWPMQDRAGGTFQIRTTTRVELRAPISGFLREVYSDEGAWVSRGDMVARIDVPELDSRIAQKEKEIAEAKAKLRERKLAKDQHDDRIQRARAWRDRGKNDLARARLTRDQDLERLDRLIAQNQAAFDYHRYALVRDEKLYKDGNLPQDQFEVARSNHETSTQKLADARVQKKLRETVGTLEAETELARREKELAEVEATPLLYDEEIAAEQAHLDRVQEELTFLCGLQKKQDLATPLAGKIINPHLKEKVGQFLHEGDLICVVEDPATLQAEVYLDEQNVAGVEPGEEVELKVRALPFGTIKGKVDRVSCTVAAVDTASGIAKADAPPTAIVWCRLDDAHQELRPGMTGYARIYRGQQSVGAVLIDRGLRYLRTEFWW